jgi:hypothetical protein
LSPQIKKISETMFVAPVTEIEVEKVIRVLRANHLQALMEF